MNEKRLNSQDIAMIVKLRGLGYSQAEIANDLGVSQSAIQYQLANINQRARKEGNDDVFLALLIGAGLGVGAGEDCLLKDPVVLRIDSVNFCKLLRSNLVCAKCVRRATAEAVKEAKK